MTFINRKLMILSYTVLAIGFSGTAETRSESSFDTVTKQLDAGGEFYMYLNTDGWLEDALEKAKNWESTIINMGKSDQERQQIERFIALVRTAVRESGIGDINGVGISSIERSAGMHHGKAYFHLDESADGILWKATPPGSSTKNLLSMVPEAAVFASYGSSNKSVAWEWINSLIQNSGITELIARWDLLKSRGRILGIDLDRIVASLGKVSGMIVSIDESKQHPYRLKSGQEITVPDIALTYFLGVKDTYLFDLLEDKIQYNANIEREDTERYKMRSLSLPLPYPVVLRPAYALFEDMLIISTNRDKIKELIALYGTDTGGLTETDEFKRLSAGISRSGNRFAYMSERLQQDIGSIMTDVFEGSEMTDEKRAIFDVLANASEPFFFCGSGERLPDGLLLTQNSSHSIATLLVAQGMIAPAATMAGILFPALQKAREKSRRINCSGNLQQIGLGCLMYAGEHGGVFPDTLQSISGDNGYVAPGKAWGCPSARVPGNSPGNTNYVYVGKGLRYDAPDPLRTILVYDNPVNHKHQWINVLFVDGHVQGYAGSSIAVIAAAHQLTLAR